MVLKAFLFVCLLDVCLHDDDNPIKAISLESPGGTPYLLPALRAPGACGLRAFWRQLGSPWTHFFQLFDKYVQALIFDVIFNRFVDDFGSHLELNFHYFDAIVAYICRA